MKKKSPSIKNNVRQTPQAQLQEKPDDFLIVGIGASAGGIRALQKFFASVPPDSGMAYVVILHLSPDHDSQLASVLQQETIMQVDQVKEKTTIKPDHVYVIPPDHHLTMEDGYIAISANLRLEERRAPVDIFFRTLADEHGPRAVSVILSGTGANGSMGMKRIKERGGATFVQNPREADFSDMPRNAIATELTDEVLNVAEIPARIIAFRQNTFNVKISVEAEKRTEDQQQALREIFTAIRQHTGHDFTNYKRPTLLRRIERRISVRNLPDLTAYARFLLENPDEPTALLKDLLISVTNFFRDKKAFETIEHEIIPALLKGKTAENQLRIWVAGCATGEEAYSFAMICMEKTMGVIDAPKIQIFATDIDETAIAQAREGYYTINDLADVSQERLQRFFNKDGDGYRVRREIRETVMFASHNFLKDPPFSHLDLVSCRNVMIYLNHLAQERVVETFHFALRPGGFLFLGNSESVDGASDLYATHSREYHIFQSRQVSARTYPVPESTPALHFDKFKKDAAQEQKDKILERISFGDLHQQLLEEYAPPSLVVNEDHDILHLTERAGKYLQIGGGELSQNLLKLVLPELRLELRSALYQAIQRQSAVEARGLKITVDNRTETLNIQVRPVLRSGDTAKGFILVVFEPTADDSAKEVVLTSDEPVVRQMEEELIRMKAQLRAANEQHDFQAEEMKASNEELQAMNEELRSAAEELETSKEELQSINEELRTVNQELKVKIEETSVASNNLQNLINSTNIGTIFLDRALRIVLFTPAAQEIFNLRSADYGRPLSDITGNLDYSDLLHDAEVVLEKLNEVEKEVFTNNGHVYLMRITPYRTDEDRIKGVVITFIDITLRKKADEALRENEAWINGQKEAFKAAVNGEPLAVSLEALVNTITAHTKGEARAAFYMIPPDKEGLHLVAGMSAEYARDVNGFKVGPESLACGLAVHTGEPVLTEDVNKEPLWQPFLQLAHDHHYRACWSFPVRTEGAPVLGTFAIYYEHPKLPNPREMELASLLAYTAAIIISRHRESVEREQTAVALRESEEKYRTKLEMDVSSRTAELTTSKELLKATMDASMDMVQVFKAIRNETGEIIDFRYVLLNHEAEKWMPGAIGKTLLELQPGVVEEGIFDTFKQVVETGISNQTERHYVHEQFDGWFFQSAVKLDDGVATTTTDITNRKAAEERLRQIETDQQLEIFQVTLRTQEEERRRISESLHNGLGQMLYGVKMSLSQLTVQQAAADPAKFESSRTYVRDILSDAIRDTRRISHELMPAVLEEFGLKAAIEEVCKQMLSGIELSCSVELGDLALDKYMELAIFRILQELLLNVVKHAQATTAKAAIHLQEGNISIEISDNGIGIDSQKQGKDGIGLASIRSKVDLLNGTVTIHAEKGKGTRVLILLPYKTQK